MIDRGWWLRQRSSTQEHVLQEIIKGIDLQMCLSDLEPGELGNRGEEIHVWASGRRAK